MMCRRNLQTTDNSTFVGGDVFSFQSALLFIKRAAHVPAHQERSLKLHKKSRKFGNCRNHGLKPPGRNRLLFHLLCLTFLSIVFFCCITDVCILVTCKIFSFRTLPNFQCKLKTMCLNGCLTFLTISRQNNEICQ